MRQLPHAISGSALALTLALVGCGGSSPHGTINVAFTSPAMSGRSLPAKYTCDGKNIPPPLQWGNVPAGTKELALFVMGLTPNPATGRFLFSLEWGVAGINPSLHKLAEGQLPPGAHVGLDRTNKKRYSLCPPKGKSKSYEFVLYAVPPSLTVPARFSDRELFKAVTGASTPNTTRAGGEFRAIYRRR